MPVSSHRAVLASRRAPQHLQAADRGIPDHAVEHEDFQRRTLLANNDRLQDDLSCPGLRALRYLKEAMQEVGKELSKAAFGIEEDLFGHNHGLKRELDSHCLGKFDSCPISCSPIPRQAIE